MRKRPNLTSDTDLHSGLTVDLEKQITMLIIICRLNTNNINSSYYYLLCLYLIYIKYKYLSDSLSVIQCVLTYYSDSVWSSIIPNGSMRLWLMANQFLQRIRVSVTYQYIMHIAYIYIIYMFYSYIHVL